MLAECRKNSATKFISAVGTCINSKSFPWNLTCGDEEFWIQVYQRVVQPLEQMLERVWDIKVEGLGISSATSALRPPTLEEILHITHIPSSTLQFSGKPSHLSTLAPARVYTSNDEINKK
jgi:hypothetical protein